LAGIRSSLLANQPPTSVLTDFLVLAAFAVTMLPLSSLLLDRAFRFAQHRGTLSTF
jgi:hypothetical protein